MYNKLAMLLLLLSACQIDNPISREYPCGTRAHQCPSHQCCWNFQVCTANGCESDPDPTAFGTSKDGG